MTAIVTWFLLIPLSLYFKYFPILFNEDLSNAFVLFLISAFAIAAAYGAFIIKKETDILLLLPQTLLFVFFVRAIPNIRLSYPPLGDPYFFYVQTINIIKYGTLNPILGWWSGYGTIERYLHWPAMQVIGATIVGVTNIDTLQAL